MSADALPLSVLLWLRQEHGVAFPGAEQVQHTSTITPTPLFSAPLNDAHSLLHLQAALNLIMDDHGRTTIPKYFRGKSSRFPKPAAAPSSAPAPAPAPSILRPPPSARAPAPAPAPASAAPAVTPTATASYTTAVRQMAHHFVLWLHLYQEPQLTAEQEGAVGILMVLLQLTIHKQPCSPCPVLMAQDSCSVSKDRAWYFYQKAGGDVNVSTMLIHFTRHEPHTHTAAPLCTASCH